MKGSGIYFVSDHGRVYSIARGAEKFLRLSLDSDGYRIFTPYLKGGKTTTKVHRLVATAFCRNSNKIIKDQVNHKDGNKSNNHYTNLEWVSHTENQRHAYRMGLNRGARGEEHSSAKLKDRDILKIRKMVKTMSQKKVAECFSIHQSQVWRIIHGRAWTHI
jgi:hypothetical protein